MAREYFCAYHSYLKSMRNLSDAECGRLFRALLQYSAGDTSINLQGRESIAFDFISEQIDRDNAAYNAKCETNRRNGSLANGGERPRTVANATQEKGKEKGKGKTEGVSTRKVLSRNETGILSEVCAEPPKAPPAPPVPPVFQIPLNDNTLFDVTAEAVAHWRELYPAVDVEQQFRKMIGWCETHKTQRKTRNGVGAFINGWLAKEQDRGGTRNNAYQGGRYGQRGHYGDGNGSAGAGGYGAAFDGNAWRAEREADAQRAIAEDEKWGIKSAF